LITAKPGKTVTAADVAKALEGSKYKVAKFEEVTGRAPAAATKP
jgi:hypothetical protein